MTPADRKERTEKLLAEKGIGINPNLPLIESADDITLKSTDDICKRAVAALLSTQAGIELNEQHPDDAASFVNLMEHFGVKDSLNSKEKKLLDGSASQQDLTDIVWEYECYWSLVWALGLIDDISEASSICDCLTAIRLVSKCSDLDDFRSKCKLRSKDVILDMLDYFYRCHWAVVQNENIDSSCPVGDLNGDVVFERRRGLEWLICDTEDWYDISLDT